MLRKYFNNTEQQRKKKTETKTKKQQLLMNQKELHGPKLEKHFYGKTIHVNNIQ